VCVPQKNPPSVMAYGEYFPCGYYRSDVLQ